MAGWTNQFALSVELTRLMPVAGLAAAGAGGALIKLARGLRAAGSDIVIEEDLAAVFRQNRIDDAFEQSFRTEITKVSNVTALDRLLAISLQSGPGVTVGRALKDPAYMPFIIQTSLLCAVHDIDALSEGLAEALRLRSENPNDTPRAVLATSTEFKGTLTACADQTAGFRWELLIREVQDLLGIAKWVPDVGDGPDIADRYLALPVAILQAGLDMFAAVQRLYNDCQVKINSCQGCVTVVIWAHHVLGLTVHVVQSPTRTVVFGLGSPSVIVTFPEQDIWDKNCAVDLLNASGEVLLRVMPEPEGLQQMSAELKIPAYGYCYYVFAHDELLLESQAISDMCTYTAALALKFSSRLKIGHRGSATPGRTGDASFITGTRDIEHATRFLLGDQKYDMKLVRSYLQALDPLEIEEMEPPPALLFLKTQNWQPERHWGRLLDAAARLAFLMLAFAAVGDLKACNNLVLASFENVPPYPLHAREAGSPIVVDYDHWYRVIAYLLTGRSRQLEADATALVSGWGWSLFHDCVADCDPASIIPGRIWIQQGIPTHEGRTAHRIIDGTKDVTTHAPWAVKLEGPGATIRSHNAVGVTSTRFMIAHRDDTFTVSRRYKIEGVSGHVSVGYLALAAARWDLPMVRKCKTNCPNLETGRREVGYDQTRLSIGMASMKGFCFWKQGGPRGETSSAPQAPVERVAIALTAGNKHAQWLSLIATADAHMAHTLDDPFAPEPRTPVLRGPDVCLSCFVQQASGLEGELTLIL